MNEPDWAKVLEYFYQERNVDIQFYEGLPPNELDAIKNSDIDQDSLEEILFHMEEIGLLEYKEVPVSVATQEGNHETTSANFTLSEKGFEVAHEREITKSQQETNRSSARLSAYLVVAIILQSLISITQLEGGWEVVLLSLIILGLVFVVFIELVGDSIESQIESLRSSF